MVYLADMLCMMMGIGGGSDGLAYRFHEEVVKGLGFSQTDLQEVMAEFALQLGDVERLFFPDIVLAKTNDFQEM